MDPPLNAKEEDDGYVPMNEKDRYTYNVYEPEKFHNAPVGLQLLGRRPEDGNRIFSNEMIRLCKPKGWIGILASFHRNI